MLYRLLRNNRESGPFTAFQLKEMGLKPYDLLWTEGRAGAWQYASELAELKDFAPTVEEQPFERFYKRKDENKTPEQIKVAVKKTKPRYRISNGQLIMVEAGNMEVSNTGVIQETTSLRKVAEQSSEPKATVAPEWQNTYSEWQPQPKKEVAKKEEPVEVETKYSESLDDLKKRYAEKVLGDKKERYSSLSSASVKQNIMAAVALVVLAAGGYIGYALKKKDDATGNGKPLIERADVAGNASLQSQPADNTEPENNAETSQINTQPKSDADKASEAINNIATAKTNAQKSSVLPDAVKQNNVTPSVNASQNKDGITTDKTIAKPVASDKNEVAKTNGDLPADKPVSQSSATVAKNNGNSSNSVSLPPVAPPAAKPVASDKQISDYVAVKKVGGSGSGVQNIKLVVSNVSDFPIDLAVVDVQYFDSKGKYQKGETMYVKDINGGNNVEVRIPDSDKSSSIKYKVSMVQADQKTLYLVAD